MTDKQEKATQETMPAQLEISTQIDQLGETLKAEVVQFTSLNKEIAEFKQRAAITPDVSTVAGDKEARSIRSTGRYLKTQISETRLNIGRQCTNFNKGMIELEGVLIADVTEAYADIDQAIKAKEAIAEARKEEKRKALEEAARVERERVEGIQRNILSIRSISVRAVTMTSEEVKVIILSANRPDDSYQEFEAEAIEAFDATMTELNNIHASKVEAEETARLQAEQAEKLKTQQEEQAKVARKQGEAQAKLDEQHRAAAEEKLRMLEQHRAKEAALAEREAGMKEAEEALRLEKVAEEQKKAAVTAPLSRQAEINIILDNKDPQSPLFVEIEDSNGHSIRIGTMKEKDEYTVIKITAVDITDLFN